MSAAGLAENLLRLTLLLGGLLLPGAQLLRALRLPWSPAAAFACSAAMLYALVVGLGIAGSPIGLGPLAAGLAAFALLFRLVPARPDVPPASPWHAGLTRLGAWTPLLALFWLVVTWRLATQPLSGPDVGFRWSWLAEQVVRLHSLDFYPPRSGADFAQYFWAESIPPGIASLYVWAYACGGSTHALWTSPVVALQLLALHELVWRLGSRWGGETVARRAVVLVAATPLLTWSVLIGQETGLTAVAVCGAAWALAHLRDEEGDRWAVLTGVFAGVAASTREYAPAIAAAIVALAALNAPPRRTLLTAAVALPLALAWPLHTWRLTGNPFYSLGDGGLFPVNTEFVAWLETFRAPHARTLAGPDTWLALGRYLLLWGLPATVGAGALAVLLGRRQHEARLPSVLVLLIVGLWWLSVSRTAGGLFYSLRVLSPALALLVIPAAYALTVWPPPVARNIVAGALALLLAESLPRTLVLPENPYKVTAAEWPHAGRRFSDAVNSNGQALLPKLQALPATKCIITDNAGFPRLFATLGIEAMPLWSPDVAWLFDRRLPPEEIAQRWHKTGLRYLVLGRAPSGVDYVLKRAQWHAPYFTVRTVAESGGSVILEASASPP